MGEVGILREAKDPAGELNEANVGCTELACCSMSSGILSCAGLEDGGDGSDDEGGRCW